jgi:hypothetical protein
MLGKGLSHQATLAFRNHFVVSASVSIGETTAEIDFCAECALVKAGPINAVFLDTNSDILVFSFCFLWAK